MVQPVRATPGSSNPVWQLEQPSMASPATAKQLQCDQRPPPLCASILGGASLQIQHFGKLPAGWSNPG
jgi:hypothetical protein